MDVGIQKLLVKNMLGFELDHAVIHAAIGYVWDRSKPKPSTLWDDCGPFQTYYGISVRKNHISSVIESKWVARFETGDDWCRARVCYRPLEVCIAAHVDPTYHATFGETPQIAICRAFLRATIGEVWRNGPIQRPSGTDSVGVPAPEWFEDETDRIAKALLANPQFIQAVITTYRETRAVEALSETSPLGRDADWALAMAQALGADSNYEVPIVPDPDAFRKLFNNIRDRARRSMLDTLNMHTL